jgi:hypothetical protein
VLKQRFLSGKHVCGDGLHRIASIPTPCLVNLVVQYDANGAATELHHEVRAMRYLRFHKELIETQVELKALAVWPSHSDGRLRRKACPNTLQRIVHQLHKKSIERTTDTWSTESL